jgi:CheY-like chemotaxis protein
MPDALIIEDNREAADALSDLLSLLEVKTQTAYGAKPGLIALGENKPDIVFVDLNMPGLSGFEVVRFIRRDPNLTDIPVIVVTSDDSFSSETAARQAGAVEVIVKPATLEDLEQALSYIK